MKLNDVNLKGFKIFKIYNIFAINLFLINKLFTSNK